MERGTLFIWLFFAIAPGVALLLLGRGVTRAFRDPRHRTRIAIFTVTALAAWALASQFMFAVAFGTAWGLAHTRPFPNELFPEGWPIYAYLAAYSALGATLVWTLGILSTSHATDT